MTAITKWLTEQACATLKQETQVQISIKKQVKGAGQKQQQPRPKTCEKRQPAGRAG
jgi:hypothetical protein